MSIKTNLQMLRAKFGKSQHDMADLLQVSYPTYCNKEHERREFYLSEAQKISEIFGMSIENIFFTEIVHESGTS